MATQYVTDSEGATFIAASQRPDGSWRKPRRVREGFVPQEEVPLYESKVKKIAKERAEQLPAGLTKETWEKLKVEQQKMTNPQVSANAGNKTGKKKSSGKKTTNAKTTQSNDQFEINEPVIGNDSALLPSGTNIGKNLTNVATTSDKKPKEKSKASATTTNTTATNGNVKKATKTTATVPVEEWVTMGKPKKSGSQKDQNSKEQAAKTKPVVAKKQANGPTGASVISSRVHDPETDMLVDNGADNENDQEGSGNAKNSERQQLTKKMKKLKSKFKEAENLKRLSEAGEKLDESQQTKAKKVTEFAKEIQFLQNQLQTLKVQS